MAKRKKGSSRKPEEPQTESAKPLWKSSPFAASVLVVAVGIAVVHWEPAVLMINGSIGANTSTTTQHRSNESFNNAAVPATSPLAKDPSVVEKTESPMNAAAKALCQSNPGTCTIPPADSTESFQVILINKSQYRADVYLDDNRFGQVIADMEGNGASVQLTVNPGMEFFVTRHGVKETLFDRTLGTQHKFNPTLVGDGATFVIPEDAAPSSNPCQDRYELCDEYAKGGKCWQNPGWMIVQCCHSCSQYAPELQAPILINSTLRCTKEFLRIGEPTWKPGDLNALFDLWATDPEYQKYQPKVLSSPNILDRQGFPQPWVITFDTFLTADEAQVLIEGGNLAGFHRSTNQGKTNALGEQERVTASSRTSSNAWCQGVCKKIPDVQTLTQRIQQVTGIPQKNFEPFQILKYEDNQYYRMHHDNPDKRDLKPAGNRILTFFLYLSDVDEGGETKFNKLNLAVKPKVGRAVVWPNVLNEEPELWDDRMYHEAMPVIQGTKYAANHWIHLNDYEGPNLWGCTGGFGGGV